MTSRTAIRVGVAALALALVAGLVLVVGAGAGAGAGTSASQAGSADAAQVEMAYNGPPDPETNAVHLFASVFKELVGARTDGRIEIVLYPESRLGDEDDRMQLVLDGAIELNVASYAGMEAILPELFAASVPFMFNSYKAAHRFFDEGRYWREVQALFRQRTGALLLEAVEEGEFLAFTNSRRELRCPRDFAGLVFRAMDESQVALYESFGAIGITIPWTETYEALEAGVADGQMNPPTYIVSGRLYEVQDYMTLANIQYSDQFLVANGEWFESLSERDQEIVRHAAHEANVITRADVEARGDERIEFIASRGVEVYVPTAAEMDEFRRAGQTSYVRWLEEHVDPELIAMALEDAAWANAASE